LNIKIFFNIVHHACLSFLCNYFDDLTKLYFVTRSVSS